MLAELLIFARALDVPPAALIAPVGRVDQVEVLPAQHLSPFDVVRWVSGEVTLQDVGGELKTEELVGADDPIYLFRYHQILVESLHTEINLRIGVQSAAQDLVGTPLEKKLDDLSRDLAASKNALKLATDELRWTRGRIRRMGLALPPLPAGLSFVDEDDAQ